jgi:thiol-disulfide isomerase/thioredoxin
VPEQPMSQPPTPDVPVRQFPIYLMGPMPHMGAWCATCVMIYMGAVSAEPELQKYAKELTDAAIKGGADFVSIDLAQRDDLQLQPAVTVAPSTYSKMPMPVCWTHVCGIREPNEEPKPQSPIVPGKAYRTRG